MRDRDADRVAEGLRLVMGADMDKKSKFRVMSESGGFSLIEILIAIIITLLVTACVQDLMVRTIDVVNLGTAQNVAQANAEQVLNKMAEDIRHAGLIRNGSNGSSIVFTRYGTNLDAFGGDTPDDMNYDDACYRFIPPSGFDAFAPSYRPGYIAGGVGPGDGTGCASFYPLTDPATDVRSFQIEYCRPNGGNGEYDCSTNTIENSGVYTDPAIYDDSYFCVWLVKLSVTYSRRLKKTGPNVDPNYYDKVVYSYQTAVSPRNIFFSALLKDADKDDLVDCCDVDFNSSRSAAWCPPPQSQ
jgi:type II secretory pathway pseudopilin PulG